jgi:hypothetical protein
MTTTLKQEDITPERIIATAKRLGITLRPGIYHNRADKCGCPVAVLAMDIDSRLTNSVEGHGFELALAQRGTPGRFIEGLIGGFDGWPLNEVAHIEDCDFQAGFRIGRTTRLKVDSSFAAEHPEEVAS